MQSLPAWEAKAACVQVCTRTRMEPAVASELLLAEASTGKWSIGHAGKDFLAGNLLCMHGLVLPMVLCQQPRHTSDISCTALPAAMRHLSRSEDMLYWWCRCCQWYGGHCCWPAARHVESATATARVPAEDSWGRVEGHGTQ